jgi:MATE family multidrug resistance protein
MSLALLSTRTADPFLAEPIALLRLAIPLVLIALVNMGMSLTDTLMVSAGFGVEALAAVAVASDFQSILFYLGAGTISGIAPLYAAAAARLDNGERTRLERAGQAVVLLLALALVPALWTAPDWLKFLGLDQGLLEAGRGYTRAMALTLVPLLGVTLYRTILTAAQRPRVFLAVTAAMLPLNALGNHLLMHGFGPIPAFGPTGAGLSSLIVATATLLVLILIARRTVRPTKWPSIGWIDIWPLFRIGLPIGVATVAELGIFLGATLYAATLGPAEVAAHTVALRVAGVAYAVPAALLQAATVRMALAVAARDSTRGKQVVTSALGLGMLAGTCLLGTLAVGADPITRSILDPSATGVAAAGTAVGLLLILGLMEFIANPGSAATGLLRGRKDTRVPMMVTLLGYWVVAAPLGLWLSEVLEHGIAGFWLGLLAGTFVTSALLLVRASRQRSA